MALKLITAPAEEPITLAEAQLHLRDHSADDTLITALDQTEEESILLIIASL